MTGALKINVVTGREAEPVGGTDSTIIVMPDAFYIDVAGERSLAVQPFARQLRAVAEDQAANLGERLHHAEFFVTRDPAVVESIGMLHDCEVCRSAVDATLSRLRHDPDVEFVVGQLWWCQR